MSQLQQMIQQAYSYPLIFASVGGSHAFGCASEFSDYDVHGVHVVPVQHALGLNSAAHETIERQLEHPLNGKKIEIVMHELKKFIFLLLKGNGNVLEDLYSPLVIITSPLYEELRQLGKGCITKKCAAHYKGMAFNQQRKLQADDIKKFIHCYRCLLMGIHLMRTGTLEMRIPVLADEYKYPQVHDLVAMKISPMSPQPLSDESMRRYLAHIEQLTARLEQEAEQSSLPSLPTTRDELEQLLVIVRLEGIHG